MRKHIIKRKYNKKYNIKSKKVASRKLNKKYKTRKKNGGDKKGTGYRNNNNATKYFAIDHRNNILKTIMNKKDIKEKMDEILMKENVSLGETQEKLINKISKAIIDVLNKHEPIQQATSLYTNTIYSEPPEMGNRKKDEYITIGNSNTNTKSRKSSGSSVRSEKFDFYAPGSSASRPRKNTNQTETNPSKKDFYSYPLPAKKKINNATASDSEA